MAAAAAGLTQVGGKPSDSPAFFIHVLLLYLIRPFFIECLKTPWEMGQKLMLLHRRITFARNYGRRLNGTRPCTLLCSSSTWGKSHTSSLTTSCGGGAGVGCYPALAASRVGSGADQRWITHGTWGWLLPPRREGSKVDLICVVQSPAFARTTGYCC